MPRPKGSQMRPPIRSPNPPMAHPWDRQAPDWRLSHPFNPFPKSVDSTDGLPLTFLPICAKIAAMIFLFIRFIPSDHDQRQEDLCSRGTVFGK